MSWFPIAFINPQYENFNNQWLKFYSPGTTNPLAMATDATGGTQLAKARLNNAGFITTDGTTIFIPHLQTAYDAYVFPTEAEADANDTTNAIRFADNINPSGLSGTTKQDQNLSSGQTEVVFSSLDVNVAAFYLFSDDADQGRLYSPKDYSVTGGNTITLTNSYPVGTIIRGIQDIPDSVPESRVVNEVSTTLELINGSFTVSAGDIYETTGYTTKGDGGAAQWKATGNSITASQSPADLGGARLSDTSGNEFELVSKLSLEALGSKGDGATNNDSVILAILSKALKQNLILEGLHSTTKTAFNLEGNYSGEGKVKTTDGERGNEVIRLLAPPSPLSNGGGINNFFNNPFPFKNNFDIAVTGSDTVGEPTTGYAQYDQVTPFFYGAYFSAGHNESTTDADGRTGWAVSRYRLTAAGDGDQFCQNMNVVLTNNNPLHTGLFGKPAAGFWNGNLTAAVDSVYFNPVEYNLEDKGFDVRSAGLVINHKRDNNTSAFGEWWCGIRHQSTGAKAADAAYQIAGAWNTGFDTTPAAGNTTKAITIAEGQEIHYDAAANTVGGAKTYATTFGGTKTYSLAGVWNLNHKGVNVLAVSNDFFKVKNRVLVTPSVATSLLELTSSQILTSEDSVVFIDATTPTNPTYTLPLVSAYGGNAGRLTFKRTGAGGTVTMQRQGSDNIVNKAGATVTSFTLAANQAAELVCDNSGNWHILYIA